ncbi:MAG TPA: HupE/UreJ family protein [Polyangia bacterium]
MATSLAQAHPFGLSRFVAYTEGRELRFEMALDATSVVDVLNREPGHAPVAIAELPGLRGRVLAYFQSRFSLRNTDLACGPRTLGALHLDEPQGKLRFEARYRCPTDLGLLVITSDLFREEEGQHDLIGDFHHVRAFERYFFSRLSREAVINVPALRQAMPTELNGRTGLQGADPPPGAFDEALRRPIRGVPVGSDESDRLLSASRRGFWAFFRIGIEHVVRGADHVVFLVLLLLAAQRLGDVLRAVAAFTVGHGAALVLGGYGLFHLAPRLAEPLIALSIVYLAAVNLRQGPRHAHPGAALGFGVVHGSGFLGALQGIGLALAASTPSEAAGAQLMMAGFNFGALIGQLAVIVPGFFLVRAAARRPAWNLWSQRIGNGLALVVGAVWLTQRLWGW